MVGHIHLVLERQFHAVCPTGRDQATEDQRNDQSDIRSLHLGNLLPGSSFEFQHGSHGQPAGIFRIID